MGVGIEGSTNALRSKETRNKILAQANRQEMTLIPTFGKRII